MNITRSNAQSGRGSMVKVRSRVTGSIPKPSLLIDFAKNQYAIRGEPKTFEQIFSMARSTVGMVTGPDGLLTTIQPNLPRLDHDPVTLNPLGIIIEEPRTNLLVNSLQLQTLAKNAGAVVDANVSQAPDGTMSAARMTLETNAGSGVYKSTFSTPSQVTWSCYVKYVAGNGVIQMRVEGTAYGDSQWGNFNLLTGLITSTGASIVATMDKAPLGYWRLSVTRPVLTTENPLTNVTLYSGDLTAGKVYDIWGGQVEVGKSKTSLIATLAAAVARAGDVPTNMDISPWYSQESGTMFTEFSPGVLGIGNTCVGVWLRSLTSSASSLVVIRKDGTQNYITGVMTDDAQAVTAQLTTVFPVLPGTSVKAALAYSSESALACVAANPVVARASVVMPTPVRMVVGSTGNGQQYCNGLVKRIMFFSRKLTESQLRALTR